MNETPDFINRPSWEIVNNQILFSLYGGTNSLSSWTSKRRFKNAPINIETYETWNRYLIQTFLSLLGHLREDKDPYYNDVLYNKMYKFITENKPLNDDERIKILLDLVIFVKKLGLTKVEIEGRGINTLIGN